MKSLFVTLLVIWICSHAQAIENKARSGGAGTSYGGQQSVGTFEHVNGEANLNITNEINIEGDKDAEIIEEEDGVPVDRVRVQRVPKQPREIVYVDPRQPGFPGYNYQVNPNGLSTGLVVRKYSIHNFCYYLFLLIILQIFLTIMGCLVFGMILVLGVILMNMNRRNSQQQQRSDGHTMEAPQRQSAPSDNQSSNSTRVIIDPRIIDTATLVMHPQIDPRLFPMSRPRVFCDQPSGYGYMPLPVHQRAKTMPTAALYPPAQYPDAALHPGGAAALHPGEDSDDEDEIVGNPNTTTEPKVEQAQAKRKDAKPNTGTKPKTSGGNMRERASRYDCNCTFF